MFFCFLIKIEVYAIAKSKIQHGATIIGCSHKEHQELNKSEGVVSDGTGEEPTDLVCGVIKSANGTLVTPSLAKRVTRLYW